jgi:hypothetical protein
VHGELNLTRDTLRLQRRHGLERDRARIHVARDVAACPLCDDIRLDGILMDYVESWDGRVHLPYTGKPSIGGSNKDRRQRWRLVTTSRPVMRA